VTVPRRVLAVVGNPKAGSRTLAAAQECAAQVAALVGAEVGAVDAVDLAELGPKLLAWGDPDVESVRTAMREASVVVVASPTYKATYTGLLKLMFDQIGAGELAGVVGVPLMVGGAPDHSLAVDVHLRPLLVEVGLSCPTAGLYVLEADLPGVAGVVEAWLATWGPALRAAVG
jgi:FMN reductase